MDPFLMVDLESTLNDPTDTNVTTTQSPPSNDKNDSLFIIIPVVVILILVILLLIVYFMMKQRRLVKLKRDILAMYQFDPCEEEWESLTNSFNNYNYGTRNHSAMSSTKNSTSSQNSLEETTSF